MINEPSAARAVELEPVPTGGAGLSMAILAAVVLLGAALFSAWQVHQSFNREFTYATSETYQHWAVARKIADSSPDQGVHRLTGGGALSASASPGWSALLGGIMAFDEGSRTAGPGWRAPLVINLAAGGLLVLLMGHLMAGYSRSAVAMLLTLLLAGLLMPLPLTMLTGMEHTLHALVCVAALAAGVAAIERERGGLAVFGTMLLLIAAMLLRYESLAIVLGLFIWAWIRRRPGRMVLPLLVSLAVPVFIGWLLYQANQTWVPAPILAHVAVIKGVSWADIGPQVREHVAESLRGNPVPWAVLFMAAGLLGARRWERWADMPASRAAAGWLFVFVFAGLAHLMFGPTGEGGRLTAYLVALGAVAVFRGVAPGAWMLKVDPKAGRGRMLLSVLAALPLVLAGLPVIMTAWTGADSCRVTHYRDQLAASFAGTFEYPAVATNSPGLIAWQTDATPVDLTGRSTYSIAKARYLGSWDQAGLADVLTKAGADVALVSGAAADLEVPWPEGWSLIGGWRMREDAVGASAVRVFAGPEHADQVSSALQSFAGQQGDKVVFTYDGQLPSPEAPSTMTAPGGQ